jgi:hypothetical protein
MMQGMSPGAALRELQQAHAGLRKARELLKQTKHNPSAVPALFAAGWQSLTQAHRLLAAIPREAADDAVLTKQLAVERYATALLVRLRRLKRHESADSGAVADDDERVGNEDSED